MPPKSSQICDDILKQNPHTSKIFIYLKTQKDVEIKKIHTPKWSKPTNV